MSTASLTELSQDRGPTSGDDLVRLAMAQAGIDQLQHWGIDNVGVALGERSAALDAALDAQGLVHWRTPRHAPHITALRPPPDRLQALIDAFAAARIDCTIRAGRVRLAPHLHVPAADLQRVAALVASLAR